MPFLDSFERPISYLRISVTDRCNFRCLYCHPLGAVRSFLLTAKARSVGW